MTPAPTAPGADIAIHMAGINKWYGAYHALRNVDLDVRRGERIVICGPSGSGKSTLIRTINQLEAIQDGRIVVDGIELTAGGPNGKTEILSVYIYQTAIPGGQLGFGAAISMIMLLINLAIALMYMRIGRSKK